MRRETLDKAIAEARRFIEAAEAAKHPETKSYRTGDKATITYAVREGLRNAAAKRASMDLTRTLADLRQGR